MDAAMKARLEAGGFRETTVSEFLGLTPEENEWIETRLALSRLIKQRRQESSLTPQELKKRLGPDAALISKMDNSGEDISLEWMLRVAFALGASRQEIGQALCS